MSNASHIDIGPAKLRLKAALRKHIGRGSVTAVSALAARISVEERTMRSYYDGQALPGMAAFLAMVRELPPDFLNDMLAGTGKGGCREIVGETEERRALTDLTMCAATVSRALEDDRITHNEWPEVQEHLRRVRADCDALEAKHGAAA